MTAYNKQDLDNKLAQATAQEAFYDGMISETIYTGILQAHPYTLYTPNFFICAGLALLTFIIGVFVSALVGLIVFASAGSSSGVTALLVVLSIAAYVALEILVNKKKHFNAGTDNMLMVLVVVMMFSAFFVTTDNSLAACAVLFVICGWLCYRFTDAFMGILAYAFLYAWLFFLCAQVSSHAPAITPFVLLFFSALSYWAMGVLYKQRQSLYHRNCITGVQVLAACSFYISVNYFAVRQVGGSVFNPGEELNAPLPFGWLLWVLTIIIPLTYLWYGVRAKSLLFIRLGVILAAASIATIRYYHAIMPIQIAFMLLGAILIVTSYLLITYLRKPRHGFVFSSNTKNPNKLQNAEALLIAQAFNVKQVQAPGPGVEFGGGTSGGGGASGGY